MVSNHENHDLLDSYPVTKWNGGKIHEITPNVFHLMRGQVFTIEDSTFFTFGGADSTDKAWRKEGVSWWAREMPSRAEYEEGFANLARVGNKVDYIITHNAPNHIIDYIGSMHYNHDEITNYFEVISREVEFKWWYFGHHHEDRNFTISNNFDKNYSCIYNRVIKI